MLRPPIHLLPIDESRQLIVKRVLHQLLLLTRQQLPIPPEPDRHIRAVRDAPLLRHRLIHTLRPPLDAVSIHQTPGPMPHQRVDKPALQRMDLDIRVDAPKRIGPVPTVRRQASPRIVMAHQGLARRQRVVRLEALEQALEAVLGRAPVAVDEVLVAALADQQLDAAAQHLGREAAAVDFVEQAVSHEGAVGCGAELVVLDSCAGFHERFGVEVAQLA